MQLGSEWSQVRRMLLEECWAENPVQRSGMAQVSDTLNHLLEEHFGSSNKKIEISERAVCSRHTTEDIGDALLGGAAENEEERTRDFSSGGRVLTWKYVA